MYKVKRFSKGTKVNKILKNAKSQAINNPIAAAGFGLMGVNSALNIYNSKQSRNARKATLNTLSKLGPKDKLVILD